MDYKTIKTQNWAISIDTPGEYVTELEDIGQSILLILGTRTGSDPLRPDFGTLLYEWQDKPITVAIPNIKLEILKGIKAFEPRAKVISIGHSLSVDGSNITFTITYEVSVTSETASLNFILVR